MRMRKKHTMDWTRKVYGRSVPGPLEEAWKLRALEEVWSAGGGCMGAAFLDVSKCYEGVTHVVAGRRALEAGCPSTVIKLAMHMYQGSRRLMVEGAMAAPLQGNSGLMAGCSFARDFLKAFLLPLTSGQHAEHLRDYVDDIVVLHLGQTLGTLRRT